MKFPESQIAHKYLDGLRGIEIGAAAHNPFGLNTINVDRFANTDPGYLPYAQEQIRLCGEEVQVDVVAPGDKLPFKDNEYDFVLSSHVLEHIFDPIGALKEWRRVAKQYVVVIVPHRDALESDKAKPITPLMELVQRHTGVIPHNDADDHHTRWTTSSFISMALIAGLRAVCVMPFDDKVGNGMMFVLVESACDVSFPE